MLASNFGALWCTTSPCPPPLSCCCLTLACPFLATHSLAELLIILWGLFFIATRHDREPELKARNFAKSLRVGKDIVTRRRSLSVERSSVRSTEERPHWEAAYRGSNPNSTAAATMIAGPFLGSGGTQGGIAAAVGFPTIPPANGGTYTDSVATRRASIGSSNGSTSNGHHPRRPVSSRR